MKKFVRIIMWILAFILLLVLIAFLLPKQYKVEKDVYIKADKALIYNLVCNLNKWDLWTPWNKALDSTAVYEMTGPDCEAGTTRKWNGKVLGNGEMTITELIPGELVRYDLAFNHGKYKSKGKFEITQTGDSCKVGWFDEGDLGYNPISRYMGLFMERMLGPDFIKGLAKMKTVCEERSSWPRIEEKGMPEQTVLLIRDSADMKTYGEKLGKGFMEIQNFIKANKLKCTSAPFAIYLKWDSVTMKSTMDIGMAVEKADKGKGRIRVEKIPGQEFVVAYYFGAYDKTAKTYHILDQYVKESGKTMAGGPWEIYITDPMKEKDTLKWETDIAFPVK